MNDTERQRIAAAINVLRPDWPTTSLATLLGRVELAQRPRRDVAVALVWVACEAETKTPARVLEAGPWWQAAATGERETGQRPPKRDEACPTCGRWTTGCICSLRVVGDQAVPVERERGTDRPAPTTDLPGHVARARAAVRAATAPSTPADPRATPVPSTTSPTTEDAAG